MPNDFDYETELQLAVDVVRQCSEVCRAAQDNLADGVLTKPDGSPVTVADMACQALLCRAIRAEFPEDLIIGEETADELRTPVGASYLEQAVALTRRAAPTASSDDVCRWIDWGAHREFAPRLWTMDPIDGTMGFIRGEHYAVCLALIVEGRVDVAVLGCPTLAVDPLRPESETGVILFAARGGGAWQRPISDNQQQPAPVRVSPQTDPTQTRFCESTETSPGWAENTAAVASHLGSSAPKLRAGSQVKYAIVARGQVDAYFRAPKRVNRREKIWDHASGALLVEEAGGGVSDLLGKPLDFGRGAELTANRGLVATNGALHEAVLTALGELRITE